MKHSNQVEANELKASINIVDVVSRYYELEKDGSGFRFKDNHSIKVSQEKQIITDFGSGKFSGYHDAISFYQIQNNLSFSEALKQLSNNDYQQTIYKSTVTTSKKQVKQSKGINLSKSDLELISGFPITTKHKEQFISKRGFLPSKNFISITPELIKAVQENNSRLASTLKYHSDNNYHLIILHRDRSNIAFTLRYYSFNPIGKNPKKLTLKGHSSPIYGQEHISIDTKKIVFVEGEEKSEVGNFYRKDNSIVFLSMPGITSFNAVLEFVKNNPDYDYDYGVLFDNENRKNEVETGYKLACKIKEFTDKICIIDLPTPPKNGKTDLDSYLKNFNENDRSLALENILKDCCSLSDYKEKYSKFLSNEKIDKTSNLSPIGERVRHIWKDSKPDNKEYITKEQGIEAYRQALRTGKNILNMSNPGDGKTYNTLEYINSLDTKSIIALPAKIQRDKIGLDNNYQIKESLSDIVSKSINKNQKLSNDEKKHHIESIEKLTTTGNSKGVYTYLGRKGIKIEKPGVDIDKNLAMTQKMLFNSENYQTDDNYKLIYIDESPINSLINRQEITRKDLTDYKNLIKDIYKDDNNDLINFIDICCEFIDKSIIDLEGMELREKLLEIFRSKRNSFTRITKNLSEMDIRLDDTKILNKLTTSPLEASNIPKYDFMNSLIKSFINSNVYFIYREFSLGYFEVLEKKELSLMDQQIIMTDATANPELLKKLGFNFDIISKPNVKIENIKYTLICDRTYTASHLDIDWIIKDAIERASDRLTLFTVPLSVKELIKERLPKNITVIHHGSSETKSTNDYSHYELSLVIPSKNNFNGIVRRAKIIDPSINESKEHYENISTGYIEDGKEHSFNHKTFYNPTLKGLLEEEREAQIFQSHFRIKRNTTEFKEFVTYGNISLKKFGLIPDKIIINRSKNESKITHKKDYEILKSHLKYSINELGFYSEKFTFLGGGGNR